MTKRSILSTLRRSGPMYASELGNNERKLYDLIRVGHVNVTRGVDKRYLYTITPEGELWLDERRGFLTGLSWPVTIWRRLFK